MRLRNTESLRDRGLTKAFPVPATTSSRFFPAIPHLVVFHGHPKSTVNSILIDSG